MAHRPSGRVISLMPGGGGPSRHQCAGCGAPIWHVQGAWRKAYDEWAKSYADCGQRPVSERTEGMDHGSS